MVSYCTGQWDECAVAEAALPTEISPSTRGAPHARLDSRSRCGPPRTRSFFSPVEASPLDESSARSSATLSFGMDPRSMVAKCAGPRPRAKTAALSPASPPTSCRATCRRNTALLVPRVSPPAMSAHDGGCGGGGGGDGCGGGGCDSESAGPIAPRPSRRGGAAKCGKCKVRAAPLCTQSDSGTYLLLQTACARSRRRDGHTSPLCRVRLSPAG